MSGKAIHSGTKIPLVRGVRTNEGYIPQGTVVQVRNPKGSKVKVQTESGLSFRAPRSALPGFE